MSPDESRRRPKTLALGLVEALSQRIRDGRLATGDKLPTEAAIRAEFEVSRTVVREAISKLQAAGLVQTRHGIGSFVAAASDSFRIAPAQMATLNDVVAVLELRIGVETEAAGLAAERRSAAHLALLRAALEAFSQALAAGRDAVAADFQFHLEIARATANPHFEQLMLTFGSMIIPRARLSSEQADDSAERQAYLTRVNAEHAQILAAITAQDANAARAAMRTHLANSRERRRQAALALQAQIS